MLLVVVQRQRRCVDAQWILVGAMARSRDGDTGGGGGQHERRCGDAGCAEGFVIRHNRRHVNESQGLLFVCCVGRLVVREARWGCVVAAPLDEGGS